MSSLNVDQHVLYQLANAQIREYPYPHFYLPSIFPDDYFQAIRKYWPAENDFISLPKTGRVPKGQYEQRFIFQLSQESLASLSGEKKEFWGNFKSWLLGRQLIDLLVNKFKPYIRDLRIDLDKLTYSLRSECLVVRDYSQYHIGPHTDAPHRLLSILFYCPKTSEHPELGTSLYMPKDPDFSCEGGPHYSFDNFTRISTAPYVPNSVFCFLKTDKCFHGVEPIVQPSIERDLILYDIRIENIANKAMEKSSSALDRLLGGLIRS